ncbi:MAG: N-acetyltransferase [Chitinophagaceae bacterium]|nr:MAG: N-acetyltransferase [Chitinophagaceae bacterium]
MQITTNRLLLREMTLSDEQALFKIFEHPDFFYAAAMQDNIPLPEAAKQYAMWAHSTAIEPQRASWFMAVILPETGKFIGAVVLVDMLDTREYGRQMEIGYFVDVKHQQNGYASEAAFAMKSFAQEQLGVNSLYTTVDPENIGSYMILEKLGLVVVDKEVVSKYKTRDGRPAARLHYRGYV